MHKLNSKLLRALVFWSVFIIAFGFIAEGSAVFLKARLAQYLIADAWSNTLAGEVKVKPWPWADTWPVAKMMVVDKDIELYVLNSSSGEALAFGPGHLSATAGPGELGATIIAGHRDTHFNFLKDLSEGELIQIQNRSGTITRYEVIRLEVIDSRYHTLKYEPSSSHLKLVSCYPFDAINPGGPLRYVVTATPLSHQPNLSVI